MTIQIALWLDFLQRLWQTVIMCLIFSEVFFLGLKRSNICFYKVHSNPGFSSIKTVRICVECQIRPHCGSPSQLLRHVRHAAMTCHSPLLHCNKGWARSPLGCQTPVARQSVRRDGAPVSRPRVRPRTSFQSTPPPSISWNLVSI